MIEKRKIPLAFKIFLGFLLVLLLFYLGNIIFYYQFSKVSKLNEKSAQTFFRMSQEKRLIEHLDDIDNHLGLIAASGIGKPGEEREFLQSLFNVVEEKRKKAPSSKISNYLKTDIKDMFIMIDEFWSYLDKRDIANARELIDTKFGSDILVDLKSRMRRISNMENEVKKLDDIEPIMRQAYRLCHINQSEKEIKALWQSIIEKSDLDLRQSEVFELADIMVANLVSWSLAEDESNQSTIDDIKTMRNQIEILRETLFELSSIDRLLMTQILEESTARHEKTGRLVLYTSFIIAIFSLLIAIYLARKIAQPIHTLRKATYRASLGKYDQKLEITTSDEVGGLVEDFNSMMGALGRLDEMKGHFMATVTHDLKSPLNRIKQRMANIEDGMYGEPQDWLLDQLERTYRDIETLLNLVHNHLDLQKIEIGKFNLEKELIEIKDFVRIAVEAHVVSYQAMGVGLYMKLGFDEHPVFLDKEHMTRVLDNLLTNALKYSSRGNTVSILGKINGEFVELRVEDEGQGIPDERKPYVFDRFYQVPGTKVKGTGLGLTITKEIVEAHGGKISVSDNANKGTIFTILIPDTPVVGHGDS